MEFKYRHSKTYRVLVGCGNIYITCDLNNDGSLHKIRMQRTSKVHCSPSVLHPLFSSATFQTRRDILQAIKDHGGNEANACEKYNIAIKLAMRQGKLAAFSCSDAIAQVLKRILEEKKEKG